MSTKIKICGLSKVEDIDAVNEVLPDYIGFVFWPKSKRYISPEQAADLKNRLDSKIKAVGVFVDEDIDIVCSLVKCGTIDVVQLHGSEDEDYIAAIRSRVDCEIIKAFNVNGLNSFETVEASTADHIMLDSGKGSGVTFDWNKINEVKRPFFLAGGLNLENVADVLRNIRPYALDISSGVETDGHKDRQKIIDFIKFSRGTDPLAYKEEEKL